jgi:hypothetical protein
VALSNQFGTVGGVFTPFILIILGVKLFLAPAAPAPFTSWGSTNP